MRKALLAAICAAGILVAGVAQATVVTVDFAVDFGAAGASVFGDPSVATSFGLGATPVLSGSFTYDDSTVTSMMHLEDANAVSFITGLSFTVGNRSYDASDLAVSLPNLGGSPFIGFSSGERLDNFFILLRNPSDNLDVFFSTKQFFLADIDSGTNYNCSNCISVSDNAPANTGIPEPASWALLIGGLGLAGAALRRRRYSGAPVTSL